MGIITTDTVNRAQCRNHDFLGSRAGNEAYADFPVKAKGLDDRFDDVTYAGRIGLFQFFGFLLVFEFGRCIIGVCFGIKQRQGLCKYSRILFLEIGKAVGVFTHEQRTFCFIRILDLVFNRAQGCSRIQGVARIRFVFVGFIGCFISRCYHGFIHIVQFSIIFYV